MKRRTFDILVAVGGLFLAVMLIVAGGLLTWAHNFIDNEVHTQLAAQKIYFPPAGSAAIAAPEFAAMRQYAGQQLTTGAQAEAYADHFIANHLTRSAAARPTPRSAQKRWRTRQHQAGRHRRDRVQGRDAARPAAQRLRLRTMGTIAGIAAIAAFIAAAVMLILSGLGLIHARRVSPAADILTRHSSPAAAPVEPAIAQPQADRR